MPAPTKAEQDKQAADKARQDAEARAGQAKEAADKAGADRQAADATAEVRADGAAAGRERTAALPEWLVEVRDSTLAPGKVRAPDGAAAVARYKQDRGIWALPSAPTVTGL